MISPTINRELHEELEKMTVTQQCKVLNFARYLVFKASPPPPNFKKFMGVPGSELMRLAGTISKEDAEAMLCAIEEGCEQIEAEGWE